LKKDLEKITGQKNKISLNIQEIKQPNSTQPSSPKASVTSCSSRGLSPRHEARHPDRSKGGRHGREDSGVGRLGGAEMSRRESYREGRVPLHTLRADIDYGFREARTSTGRIGVKVWIYKGDILPYQLTNDEKIVREAAMAAGDAMPVGATSSGPKGVVRAGGGRRRVDAEPTTEVALEAEAVLENADALIDGQVADPVVADLLASNPEVEAQLSVEEEIERRTASEHSDAPHFRKDAE